MPGRQSVFIILWIITASNIGGAAEIPRLVGETFAGRPMRLPSDIAQPTAILIIGFTQKAAGQAEQWGKEVGKLRACADRQLLEWYEMPVLTGIPRLIRPLVIRAIRSELRPELRSHFLPIYSDEADWKAALGFSVRDDAYVAIVERDGNLKFRLQGAVDADKVSQLREQLQTACDERYPRCFVDHAMASTNASRFDHDGERPRAHH